MEVLAQRPVVPISERSRSNTYANDPLNKFRYLIWPDYLSGQFIDSDGRPMQAEEPSEKYLDAKNGVVSFHTRSEDDFKTIGFWTGRSLSKEITEGRPSTLAKPFIIMPSGNTQKLNQVRVILYADVTKI